MKSSLADIEIPAKYSYGKRNSRISRITPHCYVGQVTAENGGKYFQTITRKASPNYVIGRDADVCCCLDEDIASMCSSSSDNDHKAVTIECACEASAPYAFNEAVYQKLIYLCADICRRNGKTSIIWIPEKDKALAYPLTDGQMLLTVHRWFAAKACPGDWLMGRMQELAYKVNEILDAVTDMERPLYRVQVGAFSKKENAEKLRRELIERGYDAFISSSSGTV